MEATGKFITFEGIDGCGKTTQLRLLAKRLSALGVTVVETVEPGGTDIGRQIRRILLDPENAALVPVAELLLYFASRAQNVEQIIRPALHTGATVLCDRFTDSTLAYQGAGRGLSPAPILDLDRLACRGLKPDFTILIDIDVPVSLARSAVRNANTGSGETRIDEESFGFHTRVRDGYLALANAHADRFRVIDGAASRQEVEESIWQQVEKLVR